MSLKLKIGYSQAMRFAFYFFRFLVAKNWGRILFGLCFLSSLDWFLTTPSYVTKSDKIEFEKSDSQGDKIYYFIKNNDIYHSVLLDEDHIKRGNYIDFTQYNAVKILTGFLFLILLIAQFVLVIEMRGSYLFSDAQRFAMINISRFEIDDDGVYNCVVFGRTYYKLYPEFVVGKSKISRSVSSYLPIRYAPTLWDIRHCDQFRNKSVERNNKLSMLGI